MSDVIVFEAEKHHRLEAKVQAIQFVVSHWHEKGEATVGACLRVEIEKVYFDLRAFASVPELRELGCMLMTAANAIEHHQAQVDAECSS